MTRGNHDRISVTSPDEAFDTDKNPLPTPQLFIDRNMFGWYNHVR